LINNKKVLGIVLARAGSKGLPGKNSMLLNGKPLIRYSLEAGIGSRYIDEMVISSDCDLCNDIAQSLGVIVPFKRPDSLSGDNTPSSEVIKHVIDHLRQQGHQYDMFVLLEPTSPLRDSLVVDAAIEKISRTEHTSLVTVCQAEDQHPSFMFKIKDNGKLETWAGDKFVPLRRQDIGEAYFLEGSVYISYVDTFMRLGKFCHENTGSYVVPKWQSFEIDDIWDFICVESVMKFRQNLESEND
jgi:CMP-N,N'-diacetyllegionaminic acid synthase